MGATVCRMDLTEFNDMDAADATDLVAVWAAIPTWAAALVAARPYASVGILEQYAGALASQWTAADLDTALAHHPRIGEKPKGAGAEAAASRSEQASMATADEAVAAQMAAGNAAYEERFTRVFLIRASGRSPHEMLTELERRLQNSDEDEAAEATTQLAEIALLRLRSTITDSSTGTDETRMPL